MSGIITFVTDFGHADGFPAQMKGVILGINRSATLVDITHDIPSFSVLQGALALKSACRWFPMGTVHLAVVDPGVGTDRHALAVKAEDAFFVGPDNGLLTLAAPPSVEAEYRIIGNPEFMLPAPHPTFHGRDVFAPTAARLALGVPFESVGPLLEAPVLLQVPDVTQDPSGLEGMIIHIDRFGNLMSNIEGMMLTRPVRGVSAQGVEITGLSRCFGDKPTGSPMALINSAGLLEIAVHSGNASDMFGLVVGDTIRVEWT